MQKQIYALHHESELQGAPEFCPRTGNQFWGYIDHPELGYVPTYGGPFDTFTIPERDDDDMWRSERFDQDAGAWKEGGWVWDVDEITPTAAMGGQS